MHQANYRTYLKDELAHRISKNPKYSLRAMAKQIKVSPSLFSDVLKGKKNLSLEKALLVSKALQHSPSEQSYFLLLVQKEVAKSEDLKMSILEKINLINKDHQIHDLQLDLFKTISDWHHFAILELTQIDSFKLSASTAANSLGISIFEASSAIDRLTRLELLSEDTRGHLKKTKDYVMVKSPSANDALRTYHKQTLNLAINSLTQQTEKEKIVGSETFAFNSKHLAEANLLIEECFSKITKLASQKSDQNSIYHLGIQLFKLTRNRKGDPHAN